MDELRLGIREPLGASPVHFFCRTRFRYIFGTANWNRRVTAQPAERRLIHGTEDLD